jgi:hypothetical protein
VAIPAVIVVIAVVTVAVIAAARIVKADIDRRAAVGVSAVIIARPISRAGVADVGRTACQKNG